MALQIKAEKIILPFSINGSATAVGATSTALARPPVVTGGTTPPSIQSSTFWKNKFDAGASFYYNSEGLTFSQSSDSFDYYNMAYTVDAFISMFEATGGTTAYLDKALTLINNAIGNAQVSSSLTGSQFKDSFMGWSSYKDEPANGNEQPLYEFFCWRYVVRMLTAIKNNATVFANPTYKSQYDSILAFTEVNIFDKWYTRGLGNIYREVTHISSHAACIALHLRKHTLNSTRQTRCDTVRSNIDSVGVPLYSNDNLRSKMNAALGRALSGAYSWNWYWNDTSRPGADAGHAGGDIQFITESFDNATGVWTQTDIDRFVKTLTQLVMPSHHQYVDGTGSANGWIADGWPKLGRFSVPCQQALETYDVQAQGQYMASMCVNATRWGV